MVIEVLQAVTVQYILALLLKILIKRRLAGDESAFVHLDGNSPEEREVVFHLEVAGRTRWTWLGRLYGDFWSPSAATQMMLLDCHHFGWNAAMIIFT